MKYHTSLEDVISFIYHENNQVLSTPVKLHKGLFLMFGYYGAHYGTNDLDKYYYYLPFLFDAEFKAWNSGPAISKLWIDMKNNNLVIKNKEDIIIDNEIKIFIKDVWADIQTTSDFNLISYTKSFDCYNNYKETDRTIPHDEIINDFLQYLYKKEDNN